METLPSLRKMIIGFLRQRKAAAERDKVTADMKAVIQLTCSKLLYNFEHIKNWGYWRNCFEVKTRQAELMAILPRDTAGHKQIRERIVELIEYCSRIADLPKSIVDAQELERRRQSAR